MDNLQFSVYLNRILNSSKNLIDGKREFDATHIMYKSTTAIKRSEKCVRKRTHSMT